MFRAVIADDERASARLLRELLEATGKVRVVGQAFDGIECLQLLEEETPDALFLDIEMPTLSGIDAAQAALGSDTPPLIAFITSHDDYAIRAFEMDATDYVVKDMDFDRFRERVNATVDRIERALEERDEAVDELRHRLDAVTQKVSELGAHGAPHRSLRLPVKDYHEGTVRLLDPKGIVCVERRARRVEVRTHEQVYPTYYTVDRLQERLEPAGFIRANRSALISLDHVDHMIPNGDGSYDVVLDDDRGTVITVSRPNAQALLDPLRS